MTLIYIKKLLFLKKVDSMTKNCSFKFKKKSQFGEICDFFITKILES